MNEDKTQQLPNDGIKLILTRLDSIDSRLDSIDSRFDSIDARLDSLDNRLTALEEKVDRRLQETRPIWEQVLTRLDGIDAQLGKVNNRLERVESEVYSLNKRFRIFNEDILKLQNKQEDFEERLDKFDSETTP